MSLKKRLILILVSTCFFSGLLFHFSINYTIYPDLKNQYEQYISSLKNRIKDIFAKETASLKSICGSYTNWSGLINYPKQPKSVFEKMFFSNSVFLNHMLGMAIVADTRGKIIFTKNYKEDIKFIHYPNLGVDQAIARIIKETKTKTRKIDPFFCTVIQSRYGPLEIVANSIRVSSTSVRQEYGGTIIVGRFIKEFILKKYPLTETEKISIIDQQDKPQFNRLLDRMGKEYFQLKKGDEKSTLLYLIKGYNNNPLLIIKLTFSNELYQNIKKHTLLYIALIVTSLVLWGLIIYLSIYKFIIKRITRISNQIKKIQSINDHSIRMDKDAGKDEISDLINNFNIMLNNFEKEKIKGENVEKMLITHEKLISIGRLLSNYAHEINSPVQAIGNCLHVLNKTCSNKVKEHREALRISQEEVTYIKNLLANLLDFHHFDRETSKHVSIYEIITQAQKLLKWSKKLKSAEIKINLTKNDLIFGSPEKLKQVFINLITNSIEAATDKTCIIRIESNRKQRGEFKEIHLYDNGPGVPEEIKNNIFEPFVSTKFKKGVGLGMYISFKIISNHGGEIVYDDTYKEGSHFIIRLPDPVQGK